MRADQAKAIPMTRLLAALGHYPHHTKGRDVWFLSPFREEEKPSFKVNTDYNSFYDFGEGAGGNILDFAMRYFQVSSISAALAELDRVGGVRSDPHTLPMFPAEEKKKEPVVAPEVVNSEAETSSGIHLKKVQPLQNRALIQYVQKRGVSPALAGRYVQEAYYTVAGRDRTYFGLAFPNASGGWEVRNAYFQGVIGHKDISLITPSQGDFFEVLVFEGFFDYLSALSYWRVPSLPVPALVLNSVALKDKALEMISENGFTSVRLFLDHDASGQALTQTFLAQDDLNTVDESRIYEGYKDFNAMWMRKTQRERA